jgi:pimeloyl-ACP methyl ester carboxylesterase
MTINPNTIPSIVAWIDSQTGVNGSDNSAINGVVNQANYVAPTPPPPVPPPPSGSFPTAPITFTKGTPFLLNSSAGPYYVYVPTSYDSTHNTPIALLAWGHGCGGNAQGDCWKISPGGSQNYISLSLGGRDGACWDPSTDMAKMMAAIADIKIHFNIAPQKTVIGGYSSGGDLAYRTAFYHASSFAGVVIENSTPFRDTGSTQANSLAAASWKFNVYHLAHLQDTVYPIATVRAETNAMIAAGFPVTRVEVDGGHWDNAGAIENGHTVPGTDADLATYVLPQMKNGWVVGNAPVPVPTPVPTPPPPVPTTGFASALRTGTNLGGMESAVWSQFVTATGPDHSHYPNYSTTLLNWLQSEGVGVVRYLVSWEDIQSSLGGTVPSTLSANYTTYWTDYITTVKALLARGISVICEPWQYNPACTDTDITYRGTSFTPANFADFWAKFATALNAATGNDQGLAFGLINEPHTQNNGPAGTVGITLVNWYACAQAAITAIRATGATNTILVPGMNYADSGSFMTNGSAQQHLLLNDPLKNLAVSVHNYAGLGSTSTTILRDTTSALVTWARANKVKVHVGEVAIDAGAPAGTLAIATAQWADWTAFVKANSDVILGWCWFATGVGGWWDNGDSTGGKHWGLAQSGTENVPSVYMNLIKSSLVGNTSPSPARIIHAATVTDNFVGAYPNRPVWRTSATGASYGFNSGAKHSISFEGSPDFLTTASPIVLPNGSSYWAVFKYNSTHSSVSTTQNCPLTLFGDYNTATSVCQVGFSAGVTKFRYKTNGTWTSYNSLRGLLNDGKVHYLAVTHDLQGNVHFYMDGVLTDSFTGVTYNPATTFSILGAGYNKKDPFIGQVAEAMVFNGVLSATDVTNLTTRAKGLWIA